MVILLILCLISTPLRGLASEEKQGLPVKMNKTLFIADNTPRRSSSSGDAHVPLFIIRPMSPHKMKTILPPQHYKSYSTSVHNLPEYTVKDKDVIALERLLPMFGIYPNKIIYKNPEYATAPKVQHIYLPVPSEPVYHQHYQHHSKPNYIDYHYSPQRSHLHTSITGSSDIGLKHVTPYNSNPPSVYHAPVKGGSSVITSPVHLKEEPFPKTESYIPIKHHNHHTPYVHQHVTPAPIIKYLTPDHFIPLHPTIPTIPNIHPTVHIEQKPHLHFYSAHDHSSENHLGGGGPHLGADESEESEHEHYHIGPNIHHHEQQHADSLVHHQIQAKQFTPPNHVLQQQQKPPFLFQSHYKVLPLSKPITFAPKHHHPDIKFRSETGATNPLVVKPYQNNLYYPLQPPTYIRTDPNIKPVVEQAVEESLRRHQTMKPNTTTVSPSSNNSAVYNKDGEFRPMLITPPTHMMMSNANKTGDVTNAGAAYNLMSNKCEEKCNAESKTKDENSEAFCGTNGKIYETKTQFVCAQKCGNKELQSQPLTKCSPDMKNS